MKLTLQFHYYNPHIEALGFLRCKPKEPLALLFNFSNCSFKI